MQKSLKKNVLFAVLCLLIMMCTIGLVACQTDEPEENDEPVLYNITIETIEHGSVTADKTQAEEGTEVNLAVSADTGYFLLALQLNGADLNVTDGAASFSMPAQNVVITASFIAADNDSAPVNAGFEVSAKAAAGETAVSLWDVKYGDENLEITAYVTDSALINGKDAVEFYIGKNGFDYIALSDANYGVKAGVDGTVTQYSVVNGKYAETDNGVFSANVVLWTNGGAAVVGYKATISVAYSALGLTSDNAEGNITVLPVLNNGDSESSAFGAIKVAFNGYDTEVPSTYPVLVGDNQWEENKYVNGIGQLGGTSTITMGSKWSVYDYAAEDAENYANRRAVLTGSDGDNNIVFYRTEGDNVYATATFTVTEIYNNEGYGKFGLMLFDGANQTGLFFYVDAQVGDNFDGVIRGTSLGYNVATGVWGSFISISDTDGSFDLETRTVTLAMTYSNGVVSLYCGDNLVKQIAYTPHGQVAIGIKSFNMGLIVTDYSSTGDPTDPEFAAHNPELSKQQLDVLFAGASYVEWWQNENVFANMTAVYDMKTVDIGSAGSQIYQWNDETKISEMKLQYDPDKIVLHVGLNDVNDAGHTAEQVVSDLKALYTALHAAFPDADLYWVGYIPNNKFASNNATYYEINHTMSDWAEETEWFGYIDVWTAFCADGQDGSNGSDIKPRTNLFLTGEDGMHPNSSYGYPLWGSVILEALGYERNHGNGTLGDNTEVNYYYSYGWSFDGDTATNTGGKEQAVYYSETGYETNILFQVDLKATDVYNGDAYPKAGVILRNDDFTIFAYFDMEHPEVGTVNIVYRLNNQYGPNDWLWGSQAKSADTGIDISLDFCTIAIAKKGGTVYMLVNGEVVTSMTVPGVTAETKFIAGVVGFNIKMEVENVTCTTDLSEIEHSLRVAHAISGTMYNDIVSYDFSSQTAKLGDTVTFTIDSEININTVTLSYGDTNIKLEDNNGVYTFEMPDEDVIILLTFDGLPTVTIDASIADILEANANSVYPGESVELQLKNPYDYTIIKLFVNGEELSPVNGKYVIDNVNSDVIITGEIALTPAGIAIDGTLDGIYGENYATALYSDNRSIQVYAVKIDSGVLIYAKAVMNTQKTDSSLWYENTNFEFQLNADGQRYVNIKEESNGVTGFKWLTQSVDGKYVFTVEIFVAKDLISNFAGGDIQLNYAWKTLGETAVIDASNAAGYTTLSSDWLAIHSVGGLISDYYTEFGYIGMPRNLHISNTGVVIDEVTPADAVIDGILDDSAYEGKTVLDCGTGVTVKITGFAGSDGLYLALTITHGQWSALNSSVWSNNDNIEFKFNNISTAIMWLDGKLCAPSFFTKAASVDTIVDETTIVTTVELFIKGYADVYRIQVGRAGNGFGGWQELVWGSNYAYIRANDIVTADPIEQTIASNNISLDGYFDESYYTDSVKEKVFMAQVGNASVSVMGVNTSGGILFGFTIVHASSTDTVLQNDGTAWFHYLNIEFRLATNNAWQYAGSVYANATHVNQCRSGYRTVRNSDGTYTTYMEIFVAHYTTLGDALSDVTVSFGCVVDQGTPDAKDVKFAWLFGGSDTVRSHKVTSEGLVVI